MGIQISCNYLKTLDSHSPIGAENRLHGNDKQRRKSTFYETIFFDCLKSIQGIFSRRFTACQQDELGLKVFGVDICSCPLPNRSRRLGTNYFYVDRRQTCVYLHNMKYLNWDPEKNEILKRKRGITFEEIAYLIESGQIIGIEENPGRSNQKMYILEIENYAVIVPFVEGDKEIFLKTVFPSRKYTKRYGLKGE